MSKRRSLPHPRNRWHAATRRDIKSVLLACVVGVAFSSAKVSAQTAAPPPDETPNQDDPTKAVFFNIRNEFFNQEDRAWTNAIIARSDRALLRTRPRLGGKVGILTRVDVPVVAADPGGRAQFGLGDVYAQASVVPWLTPRMALAVGTGLTAPTATHASLGAGKWQVAPAVAPVWFLPRRKGFVLVRFHGHVSFAGDDDRRPVRTLEVAPTVLWRFAPGWWTLVDSNATVDWKADGRVSRRTGIEIGYVVRRAWGVSIKPEIPWGANRKGDWKLLAILTRYRVNKGGR